MKPFHLSFVVPDLDAVKRFYLDVLGCKIGRDMGAWIDLIFFGHQLTLHQAYEGKPAGVIDHFGVILEKDEWLTLIGKLSSNQIIFLMDPSIKKENSPEESGKFVIKDPADNLLEFKYYKQFGVTVAG